MSTKSTCPVCGEPVRKWVIPHSLNADDLVHTHHAVCEACWMYEDHADPRDAIVPAVSRLGFIVTLWYTTFLPDPPWTTQVDETRRLYQDQSSEAVSARLMIRELSAGWGTWDAAKDRTHLPACIDWLEDVGTYPLQLESARVLLRTLDGDDPKTFRPRPVQPGWARHP